VLRVLPRRERDRPETFMTQLHVSGTDLHQRVTNASRRSCSSRLFIARFGSGATRPPVCCAWHPVTWLTR
jgi:hypothetical protein